MFQNYMGKYFTPNAEFGLFGEISSVHKQNVRCASGHLVSTVHLTFVFTNQNTFSYFLYLTLRNKTVKQMLHYYHHDRWKKFSMKSN